MNGKSNIDLNLSQSYASNCNNNRVDGNDLNKTNFSAEKPKVRKSIEELLAEAEKEFNLLDSAADSAIKILRSGREIQKLATIRNFTDLLISDESCEEAITRVLPVIQEVLTQESSNLDIHCESAIVFKNIIKNKIYMQKFSGIGDKLLDYILQNVENQKENVTATAWLESLVEISDSIPTQSVIDLIIPLALCQAESNKRIQRRVISARLIEKLCIIVPFECVQKNLAPCVQKLCYDPSAAVRTTIAQRLSIIVQALNNSIECVLPCLIELCKDDDPGVREAILNTITDCLPYLTKESLKTSIIPLLRKCAEQTLIMRDISLTVIARQLGQWLESLKKVLSTSELYWFLDFYCRICELSYASTDSLLNISLKRMCAYNFSCFVMIYNKEYFNERLMPILKRFCNDNDFEVRCTIALQFHEIVKLQKTNEGFLLTNLFFELLRSEITEIVQHLMGNLDKILPILYKSFKSSSVTKIARRRSFGKNSIVNVKQNVITRIQLDNILIDCNRLIRDKSSWRSHESYLQNISVMRDLISINNIFTNFVPMLQQEVLTARALPCRIAAAKTLLLIMRKFPTKKMRLKIIDFFLKKVGEHDSYHRRRLLFDITPYILENFSRQFFIENFFSFILKFKDDKVSNIRIYLCKTFVIIKQYCVFPNNDKELLQIEQVLSDLFKTEKNLYTKQLIQQFAVALSLAETDAKQIYANEVKLLEEKSTWNEIENENDVENEDIISDIVLTKFEINKDGLHQFTENNFIEMLDKNNASIMLNNSKEIINSNSENLNIVSFHSLSPLTSPGALPPSNWRTCRFDRPKMAVIRPQPQVTVTQRSPSPMPIGNGEKKISIKEELKSKLPLATTRYRSVNLTNTIEKNNVLQSNNTSITSKDKSFNKYRLKNSDLTLPLRRNDTLLKKSFVNQNLPNLLSNSFSKSLSATTTPKKNNIMTKSASFSGDSNYSYSLLTSSLKNIRRPYSLMKVQSTSDIKRKPSHMSIRVISMS